MANKLKRLLIVIVLEAFNAALSKGQGKKLLCTHAITVLV